jgi:IMP dehydrogenase/GMP reductase
VLKPSKLLSFDDVWIEPRYSEIESRANPNLSSKLSEYITLDHPVIASNMASVVGVEMAKTFDQSGSIAFHHRFHTRQDLISLAQDRDKNRKYFAFSVGIKEEDLNTAKDIFNMLGDEAIILVDIAHGHSKKMGEFVSQVKKIGYKTVVAGNVATAEGYKFLSEAGADAVRVGVAGGKVCTTKNITGHHIPTFQSVYECALYKRDASIIADGGISSSGDAAKALAAGADFVCLGSVLAPTSASPSELIQDPVDGLQYKMHYGMSSKTAMDTFFAGKKTHVAPEGKTMKMPYAGETSEILTEFIAGIKSALTYSGVDNIPDFQKNAILRFASRI